MKKMTMKQFRAYHLVGDEFGLYDLRVETIHGDSTKSLICNHPVGSYFELRGENLSLPTGQPFPIYGLAALMPILPAKQRMNHPHDWMETDAVVACPDPHCGGAFKIIRTGITVFGHSEVTAVPLNKLERKI